MLLIDEPVVFLLLHLLLPQLRSWGKTINFFQPGLRMTVKCELNQDVVCIQTESRLKDKCGYTCYWNLIRSFHPAPEENKPELFGSHSGMHFPSCREKHRHKKSAIAIWEKCLRCKWKPHDQTVLLTNKGGQGTARKGPQTLRVHSPRLQTISECQLTAAWWDLWLSAHRWLPAHRDDAKLNALRVQSICYLHTVTSQYESEFTIWSDLN